MSYDKTKVDGRTRYDIYYKEKNAVYEKNVAHLYQGMLQIGNLLQDRTCCSSISDALTRVYNRMTKKPKRYTYKDVTGFYAYKASRYERRMGTVYTIYDQQDECVAILDDDGELWNDHKLIGKNMNLHNALRRTYLELQKPQ